MTAARQSLRRGVTVRVALVAIIGAALVFNGAATIFAAVTAPQIRACVKASGSSKGLMRYVSGTTKCAAGEKALAWNVTGPAGPVGATGVAGPTGPQGPAGPAGPVGDWVVPYWSVTWKPESMFPKQIAEERETKLAVPAGTYRVAFNLEFTGLPAASEDDLNYVSTVTCKLTVGSATKTLTTTVGERGNALLHDEQFATFAAPSTVVTHCAHVLALRPGKVAGWAPALTARVAIDGLIYATPAVLR